MPTPMMPAYPQSSLSEVEHPGPIHAMCEPTLFARLIKMNWPEVYQLMVYFEDTSAPDHVDRFVRSILTTRSGWQSPNLRRLRCVAARIPRDAVTRRTDTMGFVIVRSDDRRSPNIEYRTWTPPATFRTLDDGYYIMTFSIDYCPPLYTGMEGEPRPAIVQDITYNLSDFLGNDNGEV